MFREGKVQRRAAKLQTAVISHAIQIAAYKRTPLPPYRPPSASIPAHHAGCINVQRSLRIPADRLRLDITRDKFKVLRAIIRQDRYCQHRAAAGVATASAAAAAPAATPISRAPVTAQLQLCGAAGTGQTGRPADRRTGPRQGRPAAAQEPGWPDTTSAIGRRAVAPRVTHIGAAGWIHREN